MEPTTVAASEPINWSVQYAFQAGGWPMYLILVVGIAVALLILERFAALGRFAVNKEEFTEKIYGMILRGDIRQAVTFCDSRPAPLTNTVKAGLVQALNKRPDEEVQVAMDGAVLRETPKVEGWTSFLAVFGNVATLIGLLGTIVGLILAFGGVSNADPAQKAAILSTGIAHALNCTAFGLLVAIPALIFYGFFQLRAGRIINEMVETSMTLLNVVVANRDKFKD